MASPRAKEKCNILVCGKTGVGKSSLINFILGEDVCEVHGPEDSVIQKAECYCYSIILNGVLVTIYDSPGLEEGLADEQKYLTEMYEKYHDINLVLYCHDMTIARWTPSEGSAIRLLTTKFGATFWDKVILVLTKANMVQSLRLVTKEEQKEHFQNLTTNLARKLRTAVKEQLQIVHAENGDQSEPGETQRRVDSIPVVPTGSAVKQMLPNEKHFIGDLWVTCMERITDPHLSETFTRATDLKEQSIAHAVEFGREGVAYGVTIEGLKKEGHSGLKGFEEAPYREYTVREIEELTPSRVEESHNDLAPSQNLISDHRWIVGGATVGAVVGSIVPVAGSLFGAGVGAGIGAGVGAVVEYFHDQLKY